MCFVKNISCLTVQEETSLPIKLFMCSGTIDDTDSLQIIFEDIFERREYKGFEYESIVIDGFDHMDMLFPTWTKGLRFALSYE